MIELKKCPFCGGKAIFGGSSDPNIDDRYYLYRIRCENCKTEMNDGIWNEDDSSGAFISLQNKWNTRPIESSLSNKLDIAKRALEKITSGANEQIAQSALEQIQKGE